MADEGTFREFIREVLRRHELATDAIVARLEEQRIALVGLQAEIVEQRKQIQANTQAVLSVLDRLD
jgi:hypothetical protein